KQIRDCRQTILNGKPVEFSVNLGVPNRFGVFAHMIADADPLILAQILPLRSIGAKLDRTAVVAHPNFYGPLFVLVCPLVLNSITLFHGRDVILPDQNRVRGLFLPAAQVSNQPERDDTARYNSS